MGKLNDKVAVITGGASGIGRETVLQFVKKGSKVVIVDLNGEKGKELETLINENNGSALFVQADITKPDEVKDIFAKTEEKYGKVDILFNNAGIGLVGPTLEFDFTDWRKVMSVNLDAVFLMSQEAIKYMLKSGGGVILSTASTAGHVGFVEHAAYNASKHGVIGLTKALAVEFSKDNIRINAISPGDTETPILDMYSKEEKDALIAEHPIGRLADPVEIARAAVFLAGDDASFMTGTTLVVDGGYTAK